MNFRIEARWPSSDILPQAKEAANATTAIKACATFLRAGCRISLIERTDDDGRVLTLKPRELLRLARAEGCGIRYPPRRRAPRQSLARILFAILCMALPNGFGDFAAGLEFGANRVAVRRSEGARSKVVRRPESVRPPSQEGRRAEEPDDAER
ncbi:MAG TPA: hypothetical protein VLA02_07495 [Reyranella sp.]|nr:hypothetical protein [Reyranella sp.]